MPVVGADEFVALESYTVDPLSSIRIELPAAAEDLTAHFYVTDDASTYYPATIAESNGNPVIGLPPHPLTASAGGSIYLELTEDFGEATETVHRIGYLELGPLGSGTPGSFDALLTAMDATIAHLETMRDIDYSSYFVGGPNYGGPFVDDAEALEVALVRTLQDPNMEGGLQEVLALTAGDDAYSQAFREQLDALYDYGPLTDVAELLPTQLTGPSYTEPASAAIESGALQQMKAGAGGGRVFAYKPEITTGAALASFMNEQAVAELMLQDPVFSPTAGTANSYVGLAGPPGAVASSIYGTASSLLQLVYERRANTYPSEGQLEASYTKTDFKQDDCGAIGVWQASATATSKGWNASAAVLDLTLNYVGAVGAAAGGIKAARATGEAASEVATPLLVEVAQTNINQIRDNSVKSLVNKAELITIPPDTWTIASLGTSFVEMKQLGTILEINDNTYQPIDIGSSTAFLSVIDGIFPSGRVLASDPQPITLVEAQLSLSGEPPATYTPGQTYTITATASNLENTSPAISWGATGGSLGTAVDLGGGQSQVDWTAPNPASASPITITATLDETLCNPPNAPALTVSAVTAGGRYELVASPLKGCYEPGDTINLTFEDLDDPGNDPQTTFALTGSGSLTPTGNNTATLTYNGIGAIGVVASLTSDPGKFDSAEFLYGCADLEPTITQNDNEPDLFTLTVDDINLFLYGNINTDDDTLTVEFTAQTHYDVQYADYLEELAEYNANPSGNPPEEPVFGIVGFDGEGGLYNDPTFAFEVSMPYTTESCGPATPGFSEVCYIESDAEETGITIIGLAGDYKVDPALAATSFGLDVPGAPTTFTLYLVPNN